MSTPAIDDFDDLPPCIGERMRDVFHSIFAHQHAADIESTAQEKDHADQR